MEGETFNPKDDLESLGYTFMFFLLPDKVPWAREFDVSRIIKKKRVFLDLQN
jgi:hypothetical protein